ncbi:MAG: PQQ-binding-like beta-propeller repeat protein [Fimbriimonadaceae bacterium]
MSLAVLGGAGALPANAQDFPQIKGTPAGVGRSTDPLTSGPGQAFLRWWRPNAIDTVGSTIVVDNTSGAPAVSTTGTWTGVTNPADEASNPFIPDPNAPPATNPAYVWSNLVPAAGGDPTVPGIGAHATYTFQISPTDGVARNYALFVWIPTGPTRIGGVDRFPQQFFVYEVFHGNGQRFVDVVDTFAGGTGWVRLGGGGRFTNRLFNYDGATPILIRLHNIVPRDGFGVLTADPTANIVYADAAMAVPERSTYNASPIVSLFNNGGGDTIHVVGALNRFSSAVRDGQTETTIQGVVTSYEFDSASGADNTRWQFVPAVDSQQSIQVENPPTAVGWTPFDTGTNFRGTELLTAGLVTGLGFPVNVDYQPELEDGTYEIYAWIPGDILGQPKGTAVIYEIREGATVTQVVVDQSTASGWTRIGNRRYVHNATAGEPLRVSVTNETAIAGGEPGRFAYADAIRFVGAANGAINSTPIHANTLVRLTPSGPLVPRAVVITATENGRLFCLDAEGLPGGRTQVLWTYPSLPRPDDPSWTDPNEASDEDGSGIIARMPDTGFDLSSATIGNVNGRDILFIGARNGRVYAIDVAGRGDMNLALDIPGTTSRYWSFPNDFPARFVPSNLGAITTPVFVDNPRPMVIFGTAQGRIFALDAEAGPNKTTSVEWTFPERTQPNLGPITGTPAAEFGRLFFGTWRGDGDRGRFFALNLNDGSPVWEFNGTTAWSPLSAFVAAGNFVSGPTTIPSALNPGSPDLVVVANENRWITALDAANGNVVWTTDELASPVTANLTYTPMTVFNSLGLLQTFPVVVVPTSDGRLSALFTQAGTTNAFGGNNRLAWEFTTNAEFVASAAVGRGWMYAADTDGNLLAFNDLPGVISPGTPPGRPTVVPNDPAGVPFRNARIAFVNRDTYNRYRNNTLTFAEANDPARQVTRDAFEWGETIYVMVWNFPANNTDGGAPLPTTIEYRFSTDGSSFRNIVVTARALPGAPSTDQDGVTVVSFPIQGSGNNAMPPGSGTVSIGMQAFFGSGPLRRAQNVALNPATSRRNFVVANPLAIVTGFLANGAPDPSRSLGFTTDPTDLEAIENGSVNQATTTKREDSLLAFVGPVQHGQQRSTTMALVDRSLMTLLRGPNRGLDQVRIDRRDLAFRGGAAAVVKPIDPLAYPGFEDLPERFPNDSLDYPNIERQQVAVVKDKFGRAENPVFQASNLLPPLNVDPGNPLTRTLQLTPLDIDLTVPRFQPPNGTAFLDSAGDAVPAGYAGRFTVFVDSNGNARFDETRRAEAFRTFWVGVGVPVDERVSVTTPVVDLGSLAQGTGFSPVSPWEAGSPFSPWSGPYQNLFRSFNVRNEGNVNLLNLRLAKATTEGAATTPWGLFAPANHERSWLDTTLHLWSDIDARFALNNLAGNNRVLLQKARVGDRSPTSLTTNPIRRENALLDVVAGTLLPSPAPAEPRVAVSVPLGHPVGTYSTVLRVIEDVDNNESLQLQGGRPQETYSDPTMTLRFNVRETRLTNDVTRNTAPMVADSSLTGSETFLYQNAMPTAMRDLNGTVTLAWASTKPAFGAIQPTDPSVNDRWRIFVATLDGTVPVGSPGTSPLRDLNFFSPATSGRWFRHEVQAFPTGSPNVLFGAQPGETVIDETVRFGSPMFPQLGRINPIDGSQSPFAYMAFLGEAQKQTPQGRINESRVFLSQVVVDPSGAVTIAPANPVSLPFDPVVRKSRPAVVQVGRVATVYVATGTGSSSQLFFSTFDTATATAPRLLNLGPGFDSIGGVSAGLRTYQGAPIGALTPGTPIVDLTFTARLRGRGATEVFLARLRANVDGTPAGGNPVLALPQRTNERIVSDGDPGVFRSQGAHWITSAPIGLVQVLNGVARDLLVPNTRQEDRQTGIITWDTVLGGKVYFDASTGTIRFGSVAPSRSADLFLTYTPRVLRISTTTGVGHQSPVGLFDNRLIGEFGFWARPGNTPIDPSSDQVRPARYVFTYGRSAAGNGQAARPFMTTMRLGVQLPFAVHTQPNGAVTSINVTGNSSFYQVDPANGRVYFTALDENRPVTITFVGADPATGAPLGAQTVTAPVGLLVERAEIPVPIEQAVNESQLFTFVDPFDSVSVAERRAGMLWMFWTSTRGGVADIYMQTLAPRFTPQPTNRTGN